MKKSITLLFLFVSFLAGAQQDTATAGHTSYPAYKRYSILPVVSMGIIDGYRLNYTLPSGFSKGNTSGFAPIAVKLEYCLFRHTSIAAMFNYDAFVYNYKQAYTGNSGPFTRYRNDRTRIFSGGIAAFSHLGHFIHIKHVDPFIGFGLALSNIRYGAFPQGDSTAIKIDHEVTPYLKAGARYYISSHFSLFGDAGYDKQGIVSLGFSCRFFTRKKEPFTGTPRF